MLRSSIPSTISIVSDVEGVPPIMGDSTQIYQVIVNLASNAAHAIGDAFGQISIRMTKPEGDDDIQIKISDNRCGMSRQTLAHIYDPFFTTKGVGKGTGLGLSVVHGIVLAHGGTINAESELGKGTTFTLTFPAASSKSPKEREQKSAA
jgi:two-component system cell cycle sensor histidine kinase/response regulator CckA